MSLGSLLSSFGNFSAGGYLEGLRMRRQDDLADRDMARNERITDSSIRVNNENVLTSFQRRMFNNEMNPYRLEDARLQNDTRFLQNQGVYAQNKFNLKANPLRLGGMQLENEGRLIQNAFNTEANPLRLGGMQLDNQGRQLSNVGKGLANAGRAFLNKFARQTAPMKIAAMQRSARMASTLDPLKVRQFKTQLRNMELERDSAEYDYNRKVNMNAVADASKLFRLQGTSPRPLEEAISNAYNTVFTVDQDKGSILSMDVETGDDYEMGFGSGSQMEQYFRSLAPQPRQSRSSQRLTPIQKQAMEEQRQAAYRAAIDARMKPPAPPFASADQ